VDRDATVLAHKLAGNGKADRCGCNGCRNWALARTQALPKEFADLLDQLGIDPAKDAEVYHVCRMSPGHHHYGGWYHFVGELIGVEETPTARVGGDFQVMMHRGSHYEPDSMRGRPLVTLGFTSDSIPWLLNEPEPE